MSASSPTVTASGLDSYAFKMSRLDSTRSIKGRMPGSLEMVNDSSNRDMTFSLSPIWFRWSNALA